MKIESLLSSLTDSERNYIAKLDYQQDVERHRSALDSVIENGGIVDFQVLGSWYPYEVIELGKNVLSEGHEREYAACMGIVLKNMMLGSDDRNEPDSILDMYPIIEQLQDDLRSMLNTMIESIMETCEQSVPPLFLTAQKR
jgi:hypothetical protein